MDQENNHLISNFPVSKPRVNSAPEVLLVTTKKHIPKYRIETSVKNERKSSQSSTSLDIFRSPDGFKNNDNYLSISRNFSIVSGRRLSSMEQNKEKFEMQFCRINVLLISMQLGLGFSMSGLGVYLRSVSPSLTWRDCTYWAGLPLLCSGAFGLYFCLSDHEIYKRSHLSRLVKIICASMSVVTAALTLSASIMSGSHGKWISDFSSTCDLHFIKEHSETNSYPDKCCVDKHNDPIPKHQLLPMNETLCVCKTALNGNFSMLKFEKQYEEVTCRYVFSALKDYFILQSSLMGVATGVCIWIVILHIKDEQPTNIHQEPCSRFHNHRMTGLDESPSPSFLRSYPPYPSQNGPGYISKMISPMPNELKIPRVIVHEITDKN